MPISDFRIFSFDEFNNYLRQTTFRRRITVIQNHHTFKPNYQQFDANPNHMAHLKSMRNVHINERGWSEIGQNITIFPDGMIGLCRPIDSMPAGIFGANLGALCIESVGDFDAGKDQMRPQQREAIVKTNAALCVKFGLKPVVQQVVYHHWYNRKGKRFTMQEVNSGHVLKNDLQKTCPGTNFFCTPGSPKGNTIECAEANFYPLIVAEMTGLAHTPPAPIQTVFKRVTANKLNVRSGRSTAAVVLRQLPKGMQVQVFDTHDRWARISANTEEWVSTDFLA